ncbi:Fic family protein [Camelimonas lactis]|nr:Fic/DOC family N-terminal domain-containing protein [Camelimonas lactis]
MAVTPLDFHFYAGLRSKPSCLFAVRDKMACVSNFQVSDIQTEMRINVRGKTRCLSHCKKFEGQMASDLLSGHDLSGATGYHYDRFPPRQLNYGRLIQPLSSAMAALARYDQMLKGMHNSELLLAPLRSQEAVISSRMEGTISTLDEVLQYEAESEGDEGSPTGRGYRSEAVEVLLYSRAMRFAQESMKGGQPLSSWLVRSAHKMLLSFGRGATMAPGEYKTEQNYLGDRSKRQVMFIPISPERLTDGMEALFKFIDNDNCEILIRSAIAHLEFEALHPFKDGNGRIGRMLIPLVLWKHGALSEPYFYMSAYFERERDAYIDKMRAVSANDEWDEWIIFFLGALEDQANQNLRKAEEIRSLYDDMKDKFITTLASKWSTPALDFLFTRPVFKNNVFHAKAGIPAPTIHRFVKTLQDEGLLTMISPPAGRRAAMYAFEPLLKVVRNS